MSMEGVGKILREAFDAVKAAELPTEVQGVALGKAVDLITGVRTAAQREVRKEEVLADPGDLLGKIEAKFRVNRELIEDTFEVEDGSLNLTIARTKLEALKTKGTKQIALLLAAGRQAAGLDDTTETKVIRTVAEEYGKLDPPNFASTIAEMTDSFIISGTRADKTMKARRGTFEEAGRLITALLAPQAGK